MCALSNPHLSFADGFGTLNKQVAGFHRAVPSTTLDKAGMQFEYILLKILNLSRNFSISNLAHCCVGADDHIGPPIIAVS